MTAADRGEEGEGFFGLVGVAVQRNSSPKALSRAPVTPQVRDGRIGHSSPFWVLIDIDSFALVLYGGHKCQVKTRRIHLQFPQESKKSTENPRKTGTVPKILW